MRADSGLPLNGPAPVEGIRPTGVLSTACQAFIFLHEAKIFAGRGPTAGHSGGAFSGQCALSPASMTFDAWILEKPRTMR